MALHFVFLLTNCTCRQPRAVVEFFINQMNIICQPWCMWCGLPRKALYNNIKITLVNRSWGILMIKIKKYKKYKKKRKFEVFFNIYLKLINWNEREIDIKYEG